MKPVGAIVCFFKGHKRGVLFRRSDDRSGDRTFKCPRCHRVTRYKPKPAQIASAPTDGSPHFRSVV